MGDIHKLKVITTLNLFLLTNFEEEKAIAHFEKHAIFNFSIVH